VNTEFHPPTYEITVRYTDADGAQYTQSHFVWDAKRFIQARMDEANDENEKYRLKHNRPGSAKVELL